MPKIQVTCKQLLSVIVKVIQILPRNDTFLSPFAESTLHLVLRLRGGGKKRKKKNYTTPKKIKHKHKKVKLAVLKYYRVDDNGKIHRLRRYS